MDHKLMRRALARTGEILTAMAPDGPTVEIVLIGGAAGILAGELDQTRTTTDCDALRIEPDAQREPLQQASSVTAEELSLDPHWLNEKARLFAFVLPPDWRTRLHDVGQFDRLRVRCIGRFDLICMKVFSMVRRPQDRKDITAMKPTQSELKAASENLDRIESECMAEGELRRQREYIRELLDNFDA